MIIIPVTLLLSLMIMYYTTKSKDYRQYLIVGFLSLFISVTGISISLMSKYSDTEIWNGEVVSKDRTHGTYEDPYDCFCTTSKDGYQTCQTCYETRYTVDWTAKTTVGNFTFKTIDKSRKSVYNSPDPVDYVACFIGEPASIEHSFTNYIKGDPDSLYNSKDINQDLYVIPIYPTVHGHYKLNRVINNSGLDNVLVDKLNKNLNNGLRKLGNEKQVNVIVILTNNIDPMYKFAVENAWIGAKKNDVVIFLSLNSSNLQWSDVMTFAGNIGNEFFQVKLRDKLSEFETYDPDKLSRVILTTIGQSYDRPEMTQFEYVKESVGVSIVAIVMIFIFNGIMLFFVIRNL